MDSITIELVRVGDKLVGRTVSDRWNLAAFGVGTIPADRNQSGVKRLRRLAGVGFKVRVMRGESPTWAATEGEAAALGSVVREYVRAA